MITKDDLVVGKCFEAKKPKQQWLTDVIDDRQILHVGIETVQYNSPTVKNGKHYPSISKEKFLAWAGRDVTDEMPEGKWREAKERQYKFF